MLTRVSPHTQSVSYLVQRGQGATAEASGWSEHPPVWYLRQLPLGPILCIDTDVPVRHPTVEEQQLKSPQIMRTFVPLIQNSTVTALVLKSWIGLGPKSVLMNRLAPCLCVKSVCVTICILQCIGFLTQNLAFLKQLSAFCRKQHVQTCFCHV